MLSRRSVFVAAAASSITVATSARIPVYAQELEPDEAEFSQLSNPPLEAIESPVKFGYKPATPDQINKTDRIIAETTGATPLEVAQSFIDRFYYTDRDAISQWPAPSNWNPLIVRFFNEATSLKVNNDMVDWCAAFANWCIKRAGKHSSNSAASQSFVSPANKDYYRRTDNPRPGNLVIWTCYDMTGKSLGLGHVGFYKGPAADNSIQLLSGNTARDGRSSLVCVKAFSTLDKNVYRTVEGKRVPSIMKLNSYLEIV
ncbi:CHAP domain protein [Bosea sp. LC85]|uniref:CHAP domain-containing protein n=1 Tax=Bosea sp. LC85 TaxID=1502851 RepID=UPI0004E42F46|nr:CHAP domain-containing protein [Bosea sp. LC85]KFC69249.1 CHAP domain protein [Bosea sp. LC85]